MKFAIFTHVEHGQSANSFFGYSPYVNEMNIWSSNCSELIIVAPLTKHNKTAIDSFYLHNKINFRPINKFDFVTLKSSINAVISIPKIFIEIFKTMQNADHIHLRCPGNVGLLACVVQIFFPKKPKTAKYAGNWDPKAVQPLSYRIQKWILSNTFFTKNIQVLVYGEWENQSKNIKPFFTATYSEIEKKELIIKKLDSKIRLIFVGTLSAGKRPLYAIQLLEKIIQTNKNFELYMFGEGSEKHILENYITKKKLNNNVFLMGNKNKETLVKAYLDAHFVILPSKSEGWPKAIAEGMFWGCLPLATNISCVNNMLDNQNRGLILDLNLDNDSKNILDLVNNPILYQQKTVLAVNWSRNFTTNRFELQVKELLNTSK